MFYIFCIGFILSMYILRYFDILQNLSGWGEIAPPKASHFSVGSRPLICKPDSLESHTPSIWLVHSKRQSSSLIIQWPGTRQPETTCIAQRPPELFATRIIQISHS